MGSVPSKGTPKDRRLKENKPAVVKPKSTKVTKKK